MIEVRIIKTPETREVYYFNLFDLRAVFVRFHIEQKPKGKRLWRTVQAWDKYDHRNRFAMPEPLLTQEVKDLALKEVIQLVRVMTWKEYKGE